MTSQDLDSDQRGSEHHPDRTVGPNWSSIQALGWGIISGLVATALMTLYRYPLFRALPPTAEFWVKYIGGGEPEQHRLVGILLHFGYGGAAGGVFGLAFNRIDFPSERGRRLGAIALSLIYGIALSVFGSRVLLGRLLGEKLNPDEAAVFHVAHVIYGLTLGTWLCSQKQSGDVYE